MMSNKNNRKQSVQLQIFREHGQGSMVGSHLSRKPFFGGLNVQLKSANSDHRPGSAGAVGQRNVNPEGDISAGGLPGTLKTGIESLSGYSLDDVNVNYNSSAPAKLDALAYARGTDIHIGPGQEEHLPHEAWHVVQQKQGRVLATSQIDNVSINEDTSLEREADEMGAKAFQMKSFSRVGTGHNNGCNCPVCSSGQAVQRQLVNKSVIQFERPDNLVNHNFMGVGVEVHPTMSNRLTMVEDHLQVQYDALPADGRPATLRDYAGLQTIGGWRESTTFHGTGRAVDVNYLEHPYIATRTTEGGTTTYGGEQGGATAATRALRRPAVEVYDRAMSFTWRNPYDSDTADVGNRREGESATDAYRRFRGVSDALATYLSLAFHTTDVRINRITVDDPENASEADLLAAIPLTERKVEATAVADIQAFMDDIFWETLHPSYPLTAREQWIRILRDYEIVRSPMQYGNPAVRPASTRNPARGFLHMPEHFVVAMMDVGNLRWGACEFSAQSNGDVHHFDLGNPHHSPVPEETETDESGGE